MTTPEQRGLMPHEAFYIVFYTDRITRDELSIKFKTKAKAEAFAKRVNGTVEKR